MAFDIKRYIKRYEEEKKINIYFLPIFSSGGEHYMYVAASALLHDKFMAAMSDNQIPDFAVVVAQGNGHPSDETKLKMKEYYGFVHEDDAKNDNIQAS